MVWWTGLAVSLAGCLLMLAQVIFAAVPVGQRWPAHILMLGAALVAIGKLIEFHTPQAQAALSAMRLPRRNDRKAPMKRSSSFKSQMLGFYFGINDLRGPDGVNATDEQLDAAYAINARAYQLLGQWLPRAEAWVKKDEQQPEITFSPYEICEESIEIEDVLGYEAFSFWLFSYHQVGPKKIPCIDQGESGLGMTRPNRRTRRSGQSWPTRAMSPTKMCAGTLRRTAWKVVSRKTFAR